jgi:hypothetical protein
MWNTQKILVFFVFVRVIQNFCRVCIFTLDILADPIDIKIVVKPSRNIIIDKIVQNVVL